MNAKQHEAVMAAKGEAVEIALWQIRDHAKEIVEAIELYAEDDPLGTWSTVTSELMEIEELTEINVYETEDDE